MFAKMVVWFLDKKRGELYDLAFICKILKIFWESTYGIQEDQTFRQSRAR